MTFDPWKAMDSDIDAAQAWIKEVQTTRFDAMAVPSRRANDTDRKLQAQMQFQLNCVRALCNALAGVAAAIKESAR